MEDGKDEDRLLTPAEVADKFRVSARTVWRWAKAGKIRWVATPGGHRRYWQSSIEALLKAERR